MNTRRSFIARTALAIVVACAPSTTIACSGDNFTIGEAQDPDANTDAPVETSTEAGTDVQTDAPAETATEAGTDAADGGTACSKSGTVIFDPSMGCYKEGLVRSGSFLPSPESSEDTPACQSGLCANSPATSDVEVLWVHEGVNTGKFNSVKNPTAYSARCTTYTAFTPPSLTQLKAEMSKPSGWFIPGISKVGTDYTVTDSSNCAGSSVLYQVVY